MIRRPTRDEPRPPSVDWRTYEDISAAAKLTRIEYVVLLDPRIRQRLVAAEITPQVERCKTQELLIRRVLIPLAFLLGRFESMLWFRFSAGPRDERIPVLATFHRDDEHGYFVALTYEPEHAL